MERIIKKVLSICFVLFCNGLLAFCEEVPVTQVQTNSISTPQNIKLSQCIKTFGMNYEKLFLLTEAAISANNFNIEELQSQGGYIVFSASSYKMLATVMSFDKNQAIIKITPCNGNYTFPPIIINNIFKYIETNQYKKF